MSGAYWYQLYPDRVSEHDDQFSSVHARPVAEHVYESVFGETGHSSSSGCSSRVDSPSSNGTTCGAQSPTLMQGNFSCCHSLINTKVEGYYNIESENSHGSSQWYKWSSSSASENSIFESMNRATPYSPEEKKERIERYRSKRNLRNFNKKIKYECRKTLADRRPRVRGRFAKNDEIFTEETTQRPFQEEEDDDYYSWITILDALNKSDATLISSF